MGSVNFPAGIAATILLCLTAGYADAIGFVHLGIFTANMTGNTVLLGISVAKCDWGSAINRAWVLVAFACGSIGGRAILRAASGRIWVGLIAEAIVLAWANFIEPKEAMSIWVLAAAMGLQASVIVQVRGMSVSTVVITSTMVRFVEYMTDLLLTGFPFKHPDGSSKAILLAAILLSYLFGAALAVLFMQILAKPMWLPTILTLLAGCADKLDSKRNAP